MSDPSPRPTMPLARRLWIGGIGVALSVALALLGPFPADQPMAGPMAGVALCMAIWWVFEVVPLAVTSLLPLVLLPALGLLDLKVVAANYGKSTIFLFLGGFLLALGLQRSGVHRRVALWIVSVIGSRPSSLILGFMVATAAMSMWISNTAAVMVMMPIGMSILEEASGRGVDKGVVRTLGTAVMLGVAYAADIGGMATPVGTPPNLIMMEMQSELFPAAPPLTFSQWMTMGVPLSVIFLLSGWAMLAGWLFRIEGGPVFGGQDVVTGARRALGPLRRDEVLSALVFGATALLWVTGATIDLGEVYELPGWRSALGLEGFDDGAVAIGGAILLFLVPSKDHPGEALMDWSTARTLPWGLLLLFGGGFALASGFEASGLSVVIGRGVAAVGHVHPLLLMVIVCVALTLLTELTSNTATTNLVLPILASAAVALEVDPRILMIPATLSASCAFMMPVASPTQAIVFGSGYVEIRQMVRAGIWFNVLGVVVVCLVFVLIGLGVFGIDLAEVPAWARGR